MDPHAHTLLPERLTLALDVVVAVGAYAYALYVLVRHPAGAYLPARLAIGITLLAGAVALSFFLLRHEFVAALAGGLMAALLGRVGAERLRPFMARHEAMTPARRAESRRAAGRLADGVVVLLIATVALVAAIGKVHS